MKDFLSSGKLHALEFSMTVGCRLGCKYCPQDKLLTEYYKNNNNEKNVFSIEDFKKCLDQVQMGGEISFCGMSEPFHNPNCADLIVYAHNKGYKISLLTTLVGMKKEDVEKIKNIEFDCFVLHIPDEEQNSKFIIDEEYLAVLKLVIANIKVDYYSCHGKVHDAVNGIIDKNKYAGISLVDRAGYLELKGLEKHNSKGEIVCFHGSETQVGGWAPVVLPDGRLVLCCQDYGMKHVLGNLIKQDWEDIRNGKEYKKFICGLKDDSISILCRTCGDAKSIDELPSIKIKELVEESKKNINSSKRNDIIYKLAQAENICVFGLGKLFSDHYFKYHYNILLKPIILSDNNCNLWEQDIEGVKCVSPSALINYKNILVVIFVKDDAKIKKQLSELGINNYISAHELFNFSIT